MEAKEPHLATAHAELAKGNKIGAIENYLLHIWTLSNPQDMSLIEQMNLTKLIMNLTSNSEAVDHVQTEIIKCYLTVLDSFPENAFLLNSLGVFFFARGAPLIARKYFAKAAAVGYLPAEKNFLHVTWDLIPRWHFRMLNDRNRNGAYRKAIVKAVNRGFRDVYDIGAGCGLLTLIAAKSSEDVKVVAFEENTILSGISERLFKENSLEGQVTLLCQNSNSVKEPPGPCSLIVTEIFDAAVFGEHCLTTIKHALDFFRSGEIRIIPQGVQLYATGFESNELSKKHRYFGGLPELGMQNLCLVDGEEEPYDSEYLKNKTIKYLTETAPFLRVDFHDGAQLGDLLQSGSIKEIELTCTQAGTLHGFALWFDLHLDSEHIISTHPASDNQCWEQAVFHLDHPLQVSVGDSLKVKPSVVDGQVRLTLMGPTSSCRCFKVSKDVIAFLNDAPLVKEIARACDWYSSGRIMDLNVFPLFGLLMAKKGATVYHVYKEESDLGLLRHLVEVNELGERVFLIEEERADLVDRPDILFGDCIKRDGSWNKTDFDLGMEIETYVPKKISLNALLITSPYLDCCNKVDDNNAFNFKISTEINEYSGDEHPSLDVFDHSELSTIVSFDITDSDKIDFHGEVTVTQTGNCNGILFWFDMQFSDDVSNVFSTLKSTYYDRSCKFLINPKSVKNGDKVMVHVMRLEGHLKVYCD